MIVRFLLLALITAILPAQQAAPGTRLDYDIQIPAMNDPATHIPVSIFEGTKPGPTLLITCGIHGFEFVPILAAQRLLSEIDPKQLTGRVILVRLAHVSAFERRSIFLNPHDGKNLNRVFPGSPTGTQSERIAHALSGLIAQADLHIDFHGGDGTETLADFAGVYGGKLAESQFAQSDAMARSFGVPRIVDYSIDTETQLNTGRSCNRQAVAMGKPTILVEIGQRGQSEQTEVALATRGILNVLKGQKMLPGAPILNRMLPARFNSTASLSFSKTGIWYPAVRTGTTIRKGDPIGVVKDLQGRELETLLAPEEGYILYMTAAPPVNQGESAITIARPQRAQKKIRRQGRV